MPRYGALRLLEWHGTESWIVDLPVLLVPVPNPMKNPTTNTAARGAWTSSAQPNEVADMMNTLSQSALSSIPRLPIMILGTRRGRLSSPLQKRRGKETMGMDLRSKRDQTPQPRPLDFEFFAHLPEIPTCTFQLLAIMIIHLKPIQVARQYRSKSRWPEDFFVSLSSFVAASV